MKATLTFTLLLFQLMHALGQSVDWSSHVPVRDPLGRSYQRDEARAQLWYASGDMSAAVDCGRFKAVDGSLVGFRNDGSGFPLASVVQLAGVFAGDAVTLQIRVFATAGGTVTSWVDALSRPEVDKLVSTPVVVQLPSDLSAAGLREGKVIPYGPFGFVRGPDCNFAAVPACTVETKRIPGLFNTGVDDAGIPLADDATDVHYTVAYASLTAMFPVVAKEQGGFPIPPWLPDNGLSAWISPSTNTVGVGAADGSALYHYQVQFELKGLDPTTAAITGRWSTDNQGRDILINGISTGQMNSKQYRDWSSFVIEGNFVAGMNTLTFVLSNGEGESHPDGPTGLRVEMSGSATSAPSIAGLFATGVDQGGNPKAHGSQDLHYVLTSRSAIQGAPYVVTSAVGYPVPPWMEDNSSSAWVSPTPDTIAPNATNGSANYFYTTSFDLSDRDPGSAVIDGVWSTDNGGIDILINGQSTTQSNTLLYGGWTPFRVDGGFSPGLNTLTFVLNNVVGEFTDTAPTGLRVEMCGRAARAGCSLVVVNTADSGPGSLREAINCANNHPGRDVITFAIPGAGVQRIQLSTPLPSITDPVVIDGYSESASKPNTLLMGSDAVLRIQVDGTFAGPGASGFTVVTSNSVIRGLVISGFANSGVMIRGSGAVLNQIKGNFIGTDPTATAAEGNLYGVEIDSASSNAVGGADAAAHNVLSGNRYAGVFLTHGISNSVQGNSIGTDAGGRARLANGTPLMNGAGVIVDRGSDNLIGGDQPGMGNLISGNDQSNVIISGSTNIVQGNWIGPDVTGTRMLGSGYYGLILQAASGNPARGNLIGGTSLGAGNLISGNPRGLVIAEAAFDTLVLGNKIGTDPSGQTGLGNSTIGIFVGAQTKNSSVGPRNTRIGGPTPAEANIVAFNTTAGVLVWDGTSGNQQTTGNRISGNSIFANGALGIDLSLSSNASGDGVTANDPADPDAGPNQLQNTPILSDAKSITANGVSKVLISGELSSATNQSFTIEFFANQAADPSGNGEGERYLGSTSVSTDASGRGQFTYFSDAVSGMEFYTATATDQGGNTSEFSSAVRSMRCEETPGLKSGSDFNGGRPPVGALVLGDAALRPDGGMYNSGVLRLTEAVIGQLGAMVFPSPSGNSPVYGFTATFKAFVGDSTPGLDGNTLAADGFSFVFTPTQPMAPFGERGVATGLVVAFDTFDNGNNQAPSVDIVLDGVIKGHVPVNVVRTNFVDVLVHLDPDGTIDVVYDGILLFADFQTGYLPTPGWFGLGARTGWYNEKHYIDDLCVIVAAGPGVDCIDFSNEADTPVPATWNFKGAVFTSLDLQGNPNTNARINTDSGYTGFDFGNELRVCFNSPCERVDLSLVTFAQPADVVALDKKGNVLSTARMAPAQRVVQTLSLSGPGIACVVITARSGETLLIEVCCHRGCQICTDLQSLPTGPLSSPWQQDEFSYAGPHLEIRANPPFPGVGFYVRGDVDVELPVACGRVEITLVRFSDPVGVIAYDAVGLQLDSSQMAGPQGAPETLVLTGRDIKHLKISAPASETTLLRICCELECSRFKITSIKRSGSSTVLTWVPAQVGKWYCVEYKDKLTDPDWHRVDCVVADNPVMTLREAATAGATRFYRVVELP